MIETQRDDVIDLMNEATRLRIALRDLLELHEDTEKDSHSWKVVLAARAALEEKP